MSATVNLVDTTDADRCNRQARLVALGTKATFGTAPMTLTQPTGQKDERGFDTYYVTFGYEGHMTEVGVFGSSFVASYFLPVYGKDQARIMARATGSVSGTWETDYRDEQGHLVTLFRAEWTRA